MEASASTIGLFITINGLKGPDGEGNMEQAIQEGLAYVVGKFPIALAAYLVLSACYQAFCFVATLTKTTKDDKIADKLKVFFSLKTGQPTSTIQPLKK